MTDYDIVSGRLGRGVFVGGRSGWPHPGVSWRTGESDGPAGGQRQHNTEKKQQNHNRNQRAAPMNTSTHLRERMGMGMRMEGTRRD